MWKTAIKQLLQAEADDDKEMGGGAEAPAAEPSQGPSTEQSVDEEGLSILPSYLIDDGDEEEAPAQPAQEKSPAPAPAAPTPAPAAPTEAPKAPVAEAKKEPTKAAEKPTEPAPKAEAKKEEPKVAAPAAPAPLTSQEPAQPPAAAPTADPVAERQKRREAFHTELSSAYGGLFTEEDRDKLVTEPAEVLPKLAAELHIRVMESVMHGVLSGMPGVVQQQIAFSQAAQKAEQEFFSEYGELNTPEGRDTVARTMQVFRHFNPTAPVDVVKREAAAAAMQALGIAKANQQQPQPFTVDPANLPPVVPTGVSSPSVAAPVQTQKSQEELFYEDIAAEGRAL